MAGSLIGKGKQHTCTLDIYCRVNMDRPFYVCCHDCPKPCSKKCQNSKEKCGCYIEVEDTISEWRTKENKK